MSKIWKTFIFNETYILPPLYTLNPLNFGNQGIIISLKCVEQTKVGLADLVNFIYHISVIKIYLVAL